MGRRRVALVREGRLRRVVRKPVIPALCGTGDDLLLYFRRRQAWDEASLGAI